MSAGGAGRDSAGLNAGTTGSAAMGDATGGAEVRAGLHSGRTTDEYSGIAFAQGAGQEQGLRDRAASTARDTADTVREQAGNLGGRAGDLASQARERAGDLASQARSTVSGALDRANTALDNRGLLGKLQDNPLPVLGVAFAVGFLLAGGNEQRMLAGTGMAGASGAMGRPRAARARQDLRSAVVAGLSAGLAQGTRSFLNTAGRPEGFLNTFLQSLSGQMQGAGGGMQGGQQGGRGPGSMGARPQGGGQSRPGGMGSSGPMGGGASGSRPVHREPSHRENL